MRQGILHQHADGTTHRHFVAGVTIGDTVVPDDDGTQSHEHGTLPLTAHPSDLGTTSGPVKRIEDSDMRCKAYFYGRGILRFAGRRCESEAGHSGQHVCYRSGLGAPFVWRWGRR